MRGAGDHGNNIWPQGRRRALAGRAFSRPLLDRRRTARRAGRRGQAGRLAGAGRRLRPAAGRRRRRAHARQGPPPGTGRADCAAPENDGVRRRLRAVLERRAPPAFAAAPVAPLSAGTAGRDAGHRRPLRILARRAALRVPGGNRPGRPDAGHLPARRNRARPGPALPERGSRKRSPAYRARVEADRRDGLRGLFPDRLRHRLLRPRPGHPVPGTRLGGQFGRLLRARRHRGRSGTFGAALRALHLQGARRAAGHRRRFRARAARGGHPVHLPQVRPRAGGTGRGGDHLADPGRPARRRPGARLRHRPDQRADRLAGLVGQARAVAAALRRSRPRPAGAARREMAGHRRRPARLSPPPDAARRRLRHRARPAGPPGAGRERGDGRAQRDPVGQGRPRRDGADEGRHPGAGHADGDPPDACDFERNFGSTAPRRKHSWSAAFAGYPGRRPGDLQNALPRRQHGRLPGRIAGPDGHAAAPQAAPLLRPGDRGGAGPPRPHPGRHGASLPEAAAGS